MFELLAVLIALALATLALLRLGSAAEDVDRRSPAMRDFDAKWQGRAAAGPGS